MTLQSEFHINTILPPALGKYHSVADIIPSAASHISCNVAAAPRAPTYVCTSPSVMVS